MDARQAGGLPARRRRPQPGPEDRSELELELQELGNSIGMGAMGFVGSSMVRRLSTSRSGYTHTGGMPMSVHTFCLSSRRATARIHADGHVAYRTDPKWFTPYMRRETVGWEDAPARAAAV